VERLYAASVFVETASDRGFSGRAEVGYASGPMWSRSGAVLAAEHASELAVRLTVLAALAALGEGAEARLDLLCSSTWRPAQVPLPWSVASRAGFRAGFWRGGVTAILRPAGSLERAVRLTWPGAPGPDPLEAREGLQLAARLGRALGPLAWLDVEGRLRWALDGSAPRATVEIAGSIGGR